jgi:hypothetical protein
MRVTRAARGLLIAAQKEVQAVGQRLPVSASRRGVWGPLSHTPARSLHVGSARLSSQDLVVSDRLPQDFVDETLLPHLEGQIKDQIHVYVPAELCRVSRAYAKFHRSQGRRPQRHLIEKLAGTVKYRMVAFQAVDIVDVLPSMLMLCPQDDEVFKMLGDRTMQLVDDFSAPNLVGVIRCFAKVPNKDLSLLAQLVPRLRDSLGQYDTHEISDMIVSVAQASELDGTVRKDLDVLSALIPEVEARFAETPLLVQLNTLWALTQLRVTHHRLLEATAGDLRTPIKVADMPTKYVCRALWIYRRSNRLSLVMDALLPSCEEQAELFAAADFARLAQALTWAPEDPTLPAQADVDRCQRVLRATANALSPGVAEMGRTDFAMLVLGCVRGGLLEHDWRIQYDETGHIGDVSAWANDGTICGACFSYLYEEQDNFKAEEIQRLVYVFFFSPEYQHLLDDLPKSWFEMKERLVEELKSRQLAKA